MNISKIAINASHRNWCNNFLREQNKSTHLVRQLLKETSIYNPISYDKEINNILKRYEKSFWG